MTDCKEMRIKLIPDSSSAEISNRGKEERERCLQFSEDSNFFFPAKNYIASQKAIYTTKKNKYMIKLKTIHP